MANTDSRPKLLDQLRNKIRLKHYSIRTEQTHLDWVRQSVSTTSGVLLLEEYTERCPTSPNLPEGQNWQIGNHYHSHIVPHALVDQASLVRS
jgi:hypothetical protein